MIYALIPRWEPFQLIVRAVTEAELDAKIKAELNRTNGHLTSKKADHMTLEEYMVNKKRVTLLITDLDETDG